MIECVKSVWVQSRCDMLTPELEYPYIHRTHPKLDFINIYSLVFHVFIILNLYTKIRFEYLVSHITPNMEKERQFD